MAAATELKESVMSEKQLQEFWDSLYYEVNSTTLKRQPNFDKVFAAQPRQFPGEIFVPAVVRRNYKMKRLEHVYVSNYGRLWREKYTIVSKNGIRQSFKGGFISPCTSSVGYLTYKDILVHRIVYFSFNKDVAIETDVIDHINPTHHYNYLSNLQAITKVENAKKDTGMGSKTHLATKKACSKPVVQLSLNGEFISFYESAADVARSLGKKNTTNINFVCLGKHKTAYGFRWMYKEQYDKGLREPIYSPPKKKNKSPFNPYETRKHLTQSELETESWKKVYIDDKETHYEVSNMGYVRNTETGKFLTPFVSTKRGDLDVALSLDGKLYHMLLHRLVARYFVPNSNEKFLTEVNHEDENPKNCKASNLEWTNHVANKAYSNSKITKAIRRATCKRVCQFDKDYNLIKIYDSAMDFERQTGMNSSNICSCCKHKKNSSEGYLWLYEDEWNEKGEAAFTVPKGYVPNNIPKSKVNKNVLSTTVAGI